MNIVLLILSFFIFYGCDNRELNDKEFLDLSKEKCQNLLFEEMNLEPFIGHPNKIRMIEYSQVLGLVLDEKSNELFVNDPGSKKIHVYDLEGVFKRSLDYPEGKQFFDVLDFDEDHLIAYNVEGLFDDGAERGDKTFHTLFQNMMAASRRISISLLIISMHQ